MADPPGSLEDDTVVDVADSLPTDSLPTDSLPADGTAASADAAAAPDEEFPAMAESRQAAHNESPARCRCTPRCTSADCDRLLCLPVDPKQQHRWRWALAAILLLFVAGVTTLVVLLFTLKPAHSSSSPSLSAAEPAPVLAPPAPLQPKDPIISANHSSANDSSAQSPPPQNSSLPPVLNAPAPAPAPASSSPPEAQDDPIPPPEVWALTRASQARYEGREWEWWQFNWTALQEQKQSERYHTCDTQEYDYLYIRPNFTMVTWKGWGTSLAWWAARAGALPSSCMEALVELVFDGDRGLGLSMARYAIPGGFNASLSPAIARSQRPLQAFKEGPLAPYNWSADAGQRRVMLAAKQLGVRHFEAISYSPPWWMTVSGDTAGNTNGEPNLLAEQRGAFVQYLVDVVRQYATDPAWNVTFAHINPFNEALEGWWRSGRDREGCSVSVSDVDVVVALLDEALQASGVATRIAVADSWVAYTQRSMLSEYEAFRPETWAKVDHICVHGYQSKHFPESWQIGLQYSGMREAAAALGKEVWQSEWGPIDVFGTDMQLAMYMARTVTEHINILGVAAWYYWMAVEGPNRVWGLIRWKGECKDGEGADGMDLMISKQYHVMKHFTRAVPPGARIVKMSQKCEHGVVAAYSPEHRRVAMVVTNQSFKDFLLTLRLLDFIPVDPAVPVLVHVHRTSVKEDYELIDQMNIAVPGNGTTNATDITINSVPISLTTVTLYGVVLSNVTYY